MNRVAALLILLVVGCGTEPHGDRPVGPLRDEMLRAAATWLWGQQAEDGGWHSETYGLLKSGQSLTPLVLDALLDVPEVIGEDENERIAVAVDFIKQRVDEDGALGRAGPIDDYPTYATALAATVLARLGADTDLVAELGACLLRGQFSERGGWKKADPAYGAWGMGGPLRRPPEPGHLDLSMTRHVLEALAYQPRDERALARRRGLVFLERLQGEDGGFYFSTVMTDKNKAGPRDGGGFRSYGTATADGILALLASGREPSDRAVERARSWLTRYHDAIRVPGFAVGDAGWSVSMRHYYRAASARAFQALKITEAPEGRDWRRDLIDAYVLEKRPDGSFRNEGTLMKEDDPLIATALAIKALAAAR